LGYCTVERPPFGETDKMVRRDQRGMGARLDLALAAVGVLALVVAIATRPHGAGAAASQDWSPFVLVTGLLLIGLVADSDGLFAAAGHQMARAAPNGSTLFLGAAVLIGLVTAVLNLDTSVAFLTPVLVYTARSRGEDEAALLYGCLLLSNAGSLFLPGSNLTNLILLGHLHLSGSAFLERMWAPALAALVVTAVVVAAFEHRSFRATTTELKRPERPSFGLGLLAVGLAVVLVLVLSSPALPVAAVGVAVTAVRLASKKDHPRHVARCSACQCWLACSAWPSRSAPWDGPGQGRLPCCRISDRGKRRRSPLSPQSSLTTSPPHPCCLPARPNILFPCSSA
jgi:Na+/H+ antiporter NhaD/arsenite permease-like protein